MTNATQRYLALYAGLLTIVFAVVVLTGATQTRVAKFEEIDVQRINVREPDGTLRMVVSSMARFPDTIEMDGVTRKHVRSNAGMLFFNDEGIESGGLVFAGRKDAQGKVSGFVHLSMDQYKQDQVVTLNQKESDGKRTAGLTVFDRPEQSIMQDIIDRESLQKRLSKTEYEAEMKRRLESGKLIAERVFVGKNAQRESVLELGDAGNKTRMRLRVTPEGMASIEFLDGNGEVSHRLTPESLQKMQ